jgi:DNA-binding transcriptional ArsR family regulator
VAVVSDDTGAEADGHEHIGDPKRIRALAHPLRVELIDVLGDTPDGMTATECAARTGESVASCSFHLRTLARYGYIEPGERRGREKPWRLVSRSHEFRSALETPAGAAALGEMVAFHAEYQFNRLREGVHHVAADAPEWRDAATICTSGFWATAEELDEVSRLLQNIWRRFDGRNDDPAKRPAGARPIAFFAANLVDYAREERDARADGAS